MVARCRWDNAFLQHMSSAKMTEGRSRTAPKGNCLSCRIWAVTLVAVLHAVVCIERHGHVQISVAARAEAGSALNEMGFAPITDFRRLVDLGCRDAMSITQKVPPSGEKTEGQSHFRQYRFRGLVLTTETVQHESIFASTIEANACWIGES
jgi:hypothetical protein